MRTSPFTSEFAKALPADDLDALKLLCDEFLRFCQNESETAAYESVVRAYAMIHTFVTERSPKIESPRGPSPELPDLIPGDNEASQMQGMVNLILNLNASVATTIARRKAQRAFEEQRRQLAGTFNARAAIYDLTQDQLSTIQRLINELRQQIAAAADVLGDEHKNRLLSRLEKLQQELHKRMSNFDRIFGFMADVALLAPKVGNGLDPIVQRTIQLGQVAANIIQTAHGHPALPAEQLFLPHISGAEKKQDDARETTGECRGGLDTIAPGGIQMEVTSMRLLLKYKLYGSDVKDEFFTDRQNAMQRAVTLMRTHHGEFEFISIGEVDGDTLVDAEQFKRMTE